MKSIKLLTSLLWLILLSIAINAHDSYFNDTFNRADSATVGNGWIETENGVAITIKDNRLIYNRTSTASGLLERTMTDFNRTTFDIEFTDVDAGQGIYLSLKKAGTLMYYAYTNVQTPPIFRQFHQGGYTDLFQYQNGVNYNFTINIYNSTHFNISVNGSHYGPFPNYGGAVGSNWDEIELDSSWDNDAKSIYFDNFNATNQVPATPAGDTTPPAIVFPVNMTSSTPNDITEPYITQGDTTPTFWAQTNENAYCAIGNSSANYTTMGSSRNCTSGDGGLYHTCTLNPTDALPTFGGNVCLYIACKDTTGNQNITSTSGCLLTGTGFGTEGEGDVAIERGINSSLTSRTIYTDQQVYIRTRNNTQQQGRFDKFALSGLKLWAFNYITTGESFVNMLNITPSFYILELTNKTDAEITDAVGDLINATK